MDNEDKNDIIKKVETAGSNDGSNDNGGNETPTPEMDNQEQPADNQDNIEEMPDLNENSFLLQNPKKLSIFAPKGSKEHMEINDLKETFLTKARLTELVNEIEANNTQQPEVKPETKPLVKPSKEPLRRDKPFLPKRPSTQPDPKAGNKDTLIDETK